MALLLGLSLSQKRPGRNRPSLFLALRAQQDFIQDYPHLLWLCWGNFQVFGDCACSPLQPSYMSERSATYLGQEKVSGLTLLRVYDISGWSQNRNLALPARTQVTGFLSSLATFSRILRGHSDVVDGYDHVALLTRPGRRRPRRVLRRNPFLLQVALLRLCQVCDGQARVPTAWAAWRRRADVRGPTRSGSSSAMTTASHSPRGGRPGGWPCCPA